MRTDAFRQLLGAGALLLLVSGCAYRLGSALPPGVETLHVPAVVNQTGEPLLENDVTRALVRELQRDGTLRLADEQAADARLDVTLTGFKLEPLRYERDSTRTAREYRMVLDATITLTRTKGAAPILARRVQGEATFDFLGDMASSKAQALPAAAGDLSHDIVEALVEYW